MTDTPNRRWFKFRLSTVLVLLAILCWILATRPFFIVTDIDYDSGVFVPELGRTTSGFTSVYEVSFNPRLVWAAVALAAFLAWKGARAVATRHADRQEPPPPAPN